MPGCPGNLRALCHFIEGFKAGAHIPITGKIELPLGRVSSFVWNALYLKRRIRRDLKKTSWNRGAYLVQGLGIARLP